LRRVVSIAVAVAVAVALGTVALVRPAPAPAEEGDAQPTATQATATAAQARERQLAATHAASQVKSIHRYRKQTWAWQRLMRTPLTPKTNRNLLSSDPEYRRWVLELWRKRAVAARRKAHSPPRLRAWLCIKRHEGPWNDPRAPYYGGLQMDLTFQRLYGAELLRRKGTADRWTPLEQIWVAERAYRSGRGFYPWPNTARACGII
jgi:hypothetical protein